MKDSGRARLVGHQPTREARPIFALQLIVILVNFHPEYGNFYATTLLEWVTMRVL